MKLHLSLVCLALLILTATTPVLAAETSDVSAIQGLDIVDIITLFSTVLAITLGIIGFIGYRRDQRPKFLLLTAAFAIFALKGILMICGDIYLSARQQPVFDILASLLDFLVLACIFLGMMMK